MKTLGPLLRHLRTQTHQPLRVVAAHMEMDQAVLSKIERGIIIPSRSQVLKFAQFFSQCENSLLKEWLSDKIYSEINGEIMGIEALKVCEERIKYENSRTRQ